MSLIDRYVEAVRKHLPRAQREDIASELREILQTQVEEQESLRQRSLSDDEIGQILIRYGDPREVAARYGPPRYLIGPEVFPSYIVAVKLVFWVLAPVALLMLLATILFAQEKLLERIAETLWSALSLALVNLAIVTLLFARWGRSGGRDPTPAWYLSDWDPDMLPDLLPDPHEPVRRGDAIGSLLAMVFLLCWWLGLNRVLWQWFGWSALPFEWTSVWSDVSTVAVAVISASIGREVMGLLRPRWLGRYIGIGVALDFFALFVLLRLLEAGSYVIVSESAAGRGVLVWVFDKAILAGLIVATVVVIINIALDIRRLFHLSKGGVPLPN